MALVFSAAFFLLWRHQRQRRYIAVLSASFVAIAGGFVFQYFTLWNLGTSKLVSNVLFLVGGVGLASGTLSRFGCKTPFLPMALFAAVGFVAFAWYLFIQPDITARIYAINFTFGAITLLMAAELKRFRRTRSVIDNLLYGLVAFWGVTFFIRPIAVIWIDGPYRDYENFHQSLYWITMTVAASLFLLLFALSLITALAVDVMDELKLESHTDPLSGLLNRRGLEEGAAQMMRSARRRRLPLAVVVCDLDHFKAINDTYGHACGDSVIAAFAACLRGCVGPDNLVARLGGEEFAVLLQGANLVVARLFAESTRTAFNVLKAPSLPADRHLSASFGVAEWRDGESLVSLIARADAALYEAKKAGRDRVRIAKAPAAAASVTA